MKRAPKIFQSACAPLIIHFDILNDTLEFVLLVSNKTQS